MTFVSVVRGSLAALFCVTACEAVAQDPPAKAIQDNSFLVEEAYNQEAGVVQHIFTALYTRETDGPDAHAWELAFTQEWPLFSQRHQLSYTVPYGFLETDNDWSNGPGDVLLNYRFQALFENERVPAFAPRVSLILPTGDADAGFGDDTVGVQFNLPVSKVVTDRLTLHANAGATFLPDVAGHTLDNYHIGGSAIYAVTPDLNLMLEGVGNFDEEANDFDGTDRLSSVVISPGFRYAFNHPNDAQTVVGVAAPIGVTSDAPDFGVFIYFSFEHAFMRLAGEETSEK